MTSENDVASKFKKTAPAKTSQGKRAPKNFNAKSAYGKDVSEHVSSFGRYYSDFNEIDLAEIVEPAGPKPHWWDKHYAPFIEDGKAPKIRSLGSLVGGDANNQGNAAAAPAPQAAAADADDVFDESQLTVASGFDPLAYKRRKKAQAAPADLKSARDLVQHESYQERLKKHQLLQAQASGEHGCGAESVESAEGSEQSSGTPVSYAQFVSQQRHHAQELKEQQETAAAQAAITPWAPQGKVNRWQSQNSRQQRLLQRTQGGLATRGPELTTPAQAMGNGSGIGGNGQPAQTAASFQGAVEMGTEVSSGIGSSSNSSSSTGNSDVRVGTVQRRGLKAPYQPSLASQNVFGSSSEDSSDYGDYGSGKPKRKSGWGRKKTLGGGTSSDASAYDAYGADYGEDSDASTGGSWGKGRRSWQKKSYGKKSSSKKFKAVEYGETSCGVSGIGGISAGGAGADSEEAAAAEMAEALGAGAEAVAGQSAQSAQTGKDGKTGKAGRARASAKAQQSEPVQAYNYMIQLLTRREYSQAELRQKLQGRFSPEAIATALERCVEYGYQSDSRHAEMLVRHMEFSGYGPQKLWLESRRKGADSDEIKRLSADVDWDEIAYQALTRKFTADQMADFATRNKALAYLARRGFSASSGYAAIQRLQKELENE